MQSDLAESHPELQIQLVGINRFGSEPGNASATQGKDIPWLQDVDQNDDFIGDTWADWDVNWRELHVVDGNSEVIDVYNLTVFDLRSEDNYEELKAVLVDAASTLPPMTADPIPGDCSSDGVVDQSDLDCVSSVAERDVVLDALGSLPGDLDGDGVVGFADFLILSDNFGKDLPSYSDGNIDLTGGVDFGDFLVLSNNFGATAAAVDAAFG